jgi:hypothetical protein
MTKQQKIRILRQAILDGKKLEYFYLHKEWVAANTSILTHIKKCPENFRIKE